MKNILLNLYVAIILKSHRVSEVAKKTIRNEDGSMAEYALVLGMVVVGMVGAFTLLFPEIKSFMKNAVQKITDLLG